MTIREAEQKARAQAIRENYERLSSRADWADMNKTQRAALMELECGMSRQGFLPILKELGIEL